MRPIAKEQDVLQFPLNELLGTRGNVRLLRLLATDTSGPVGTPEAAEQTGLTEAGARRALRRLVRTGLVEQIGGGKAQRFCLREAAPLASEIRSLFSSERERYRRLLKRLREVFIALPETQLAWIDAPPTEPGRPLHLGVMSDSRSLGYLEEQIRQRIADIESDYDLTIEIHTFSRADVPDVPWETAVLLAGHAGEPARPEAAAHTARTARAARMSQAIADLLESDESLLSRARSFVEFQLEADQGAATHDLHEWQDILSRYPRHRIREFLTSETPRSQRLRQSSPFFAVLTADEREEILDSIGDDR